MNIDLASFHFTRIKSYPVGSITVYTNFSGEGFPTLVPLCAYGPSSRSPW